MTSDELEIDLTDPMTGEPADRDPKDDLTPGSAMPEALLSSPDTDFSYKDATQTWVGEPARVELSITTVADNSEKRFVLEEPNSMATMDRILRAMMENDRYSFCDAVVEEPNLTEGVWHRMTAREQLLLYDHCYSWIRAGDFVTMQNILNDR